MIHITPAAAVEMRRLLAQKARKTAGLRVGVKGGGCSGLSYTMQFEDKPQDHDRVFEADGVRVFCDPKSYLYLNGLTLDFNNEVIGGGFKFLNPAARPCGCAGSQVA
jgi:iron-sulfur cluster assembly protein